MNNQIIISATFGFLLGLLAFMLFFKPENQTKVEVIETVKTDTVFITKIDTIRITREQIRHEYLRDTLVINYMPKISRFSGSFPVAYGNIHFSGEVLGEVLNLKPVATLKMPVITNTIERETTRTIIQKKKGVYAQAWVNSDFVPAPALSYVNDRLIFSYKYVPLEKSHNFGFGLQLF